MIRKPSRLSFSKEELEAEGHKPIREPVPQSKDKAGKPAKRQSDSPEKPPGKSQTPKEKARRKQAQRLFFKDKPDLDITPVGRKKADMLLPLKVVSAGVHQELDRLEEDNIGLEAAHSTEKGLTRGVRFLRRRSGKAQRLQARRSTRAPERENGTESAGRMQPRQGVSPSSADAPVFSSNPISRWQQKRAIRKQYIAARRAESRPVTGGRTLMDKVRSRFQSGKALIHRKKRTGLLIGLLLSLLLFIMHSLSSCSVILDGTLTSIASATYPAEDKDMKAAEAMYRQMEAELQQELNNYLALHPEYDDATVQCDKIEHDPYVLISMLTALKNGKPWTTDDVAGLLRTIFDKQYIRTETVTTETRYRKEWQTGIRYVQDPRTGRYYPEYYQYEASVPYLYRTVHVKIKNFNLSHLPVYLMSRHQMGLYAMYMSQLGNRPDLFPGSPYIQKYLVAKYPKYEPPPEALQDAAFAAIFEEATKYLGYPYVWGGASPTTSFDCSGFVSWVLNQSGWNIGRLGSQGLYDRSTVLRPEEVWPGDLIFFTKTFEADNDVTHVGIMVGPNTMIHCGDPIQFTSTDDAYHIKHFYAFGRIPK